MKALLLTGKHLRRRMDHDSGKLKVVIDTNEIEQGASHKLLDLIIDKDLTYKVHVDELSIKLSKHLSLLHNISPYLKKNRRMMRITGTLPHYLNTSLRKKLDNHARITRNCNLNLLAPIHKNISEGGTHLCIENC